MSSDTDDSDWVDEAAEDSDVDEVEDEDSDDGYEYFPEGEDEDLEENEMDAGDCEETWHLASEEPVFEHSDSRVLQMLRLRERGSRVDAADLRTRFKPNTHARRIKALDAKPYCAQFSKDGSLFYCATQDFTISLMDPHNNFSSIAEIQAMPGQWTITDCDLSKDSRTLVYSSIHPRIYLVRLGGFLDSGYEGGDATNPRSHVALNVGQDVGVWSIRMSDDGREVVAGCSDGLITVYDVEQRRVVQRVMGHQDDVNAVTFADISGNVLLSGSDDGLVKVWDRRSSLGAGKPAGILSGHTQGITFITTLNRDGRTAVSNAKDQTMKLFDLRKMLDPDTALGHRAASVGVPGNFDYRWQPYPRALRNHRHPHDVSVATFQGHSVLRTLIRCHYSPGNRFLYTGSSDGKVYIYDPVRDPSGGGPAQVLESPEKLRPHMSAEERQLRAMMAVLPEESPQRFMLHRMLRQYSRGTESCVRDVAWSPDYPLIVGSVWKGERGGLEAFEYRSADRLF
ncbi:WD40-repeat-containing domain protein [Chytriomyces sp. MP71]|nr:WD40-repeat-containing domain protein [Chytriomyces sp. MP71]